MLTQKRILEILKKDKPLLSRKFKVSDIALFGSYASGNVTEDSDIDILVSMPSDFDAFYDLKQHLEKSLGHSVDLGLEKNIRPLIRKQIEDEIIHV